MENIDYGELFGTETGENVQEVAELADAEDGSLGEKEQEVTEPAEEIEKPAESMQSAEDNARFAQARRKAEAERDEAIAAERREHNRLIGEIMKTFGVTGKDGLPVSTKEDWEEYRAQADADSLEEFKRRIGMTDEEFNGFVKTIPEVKEAEAARERFEKQEQEIKEQKIQQDIDRQIKQINTLDPNVKSLEDLTKTDTYGKVYELVQKGYSIVDAFRSANFDRIMQNAAAASRQSAYNSVQSKQHLGATVTRGAGAVSVPPDVKADYLAFNPEMTDAEIQRHYNNYLKK